MSSLKYHEHLSVFSHFWQKWENGIWVGEGETPQKQGKTVHFLVSIPRTMHRLNPYYIYIFYSIVYRVYRVYGYFKKSIYGIYFTFPTIRSGGWEMDLLYRVLETRKNPDLPTTAPLPPVGHSMCRIPPPHLHVGVCRSIL